jgi:hypothetical protein
VGKHVTHGTKHAAFRIKNLDEFLVAVRAKGADVAVASVERCRRLTLSRPTNCISKGCIEQKNKALPACRAGLDVGSRVGEGPLAATQMYGRLMLVQVGS